MFIIKVPDYRKENKLFFYVLHFYIFGVSFLSFQWKSSNTKFEHACLALSHIWMKLCLAFLNIAYYTNCHICSLMGSEVQLLRLGDFL